MNSSPLNRLSAELRNKIYGLVFEDDPREISLNLTKWQVPKPYRPSQPNKNVTRPVSYTLTQTCRKIRNETLKLFYFTNTLVLQMTDFEDHTSPILAPPRIGAEKLQHWRDLVGAEATQSVRNVHIKLQYHYLGSKSAFGLDPKASATLRSTFHPSASLKFFVSVHLPMPEGMLDKQGQPLISLDVIWTIGESASEWEAQVIEVAKAFWKSATEVFTNPDPQDRMKAIITMAAQFLMSGIPSICDFHRPVFGPILPPDMEAEQQKESDEAWQRERERSRRAVQGDD